MIFVAINFVATGKQSFTITLAAESSASLLIYEYFSGQQKYSWKYECIISVRLLLYLYTWGKNSLINIRQKIKTKPDIMEHNEQPQRSSAEEEFQKSLDELQLLLEENQTEEQPVEELEKDLVVDNTKAKPAAEESPLFNLAEWEDAVADIEQYFENKNK